MLKKIIQFVKYHNAFTIGMILVFVFGASVFASDTVRETVFGKAIVEQQGIDNSALLAADLGDFDFEMTIIGVSEDNQNYYVNYTYKTLDIVDGVWQEVSQSETLTVSKSALGGRDLGLYVAEELGEIVDSEIAYLTEVQTAEKQKGQTFVQETTKYTGLIGMVLNPVTKELPGYTPVVKPPEPTTVVYTEPQPQPASSESESLSVPESGSLETQIFYYDGDGDGYGGPGSYNVGIQPEGYVANEDDCNDYNAAINPGAAEVCDDGIDNNCSGQVDENCTTDTETYTGPTSVTSTTTETTTTEATTTEATTTTETVTTTETTTTESITETATSSEATTTSSTSSEQAEPVCEPTEEVCDGLDNNCDDQIDENLFQQCGSTDIGACQYGSQSCEAGVWSECQGAIEPVEEVCDDNIDNNCNNQTDENCTIEPPTSDTTTSTATTTP